MDRGTVHRPFMGITAQRRATSRLWARYDTDAMNDQTRTADGVYDQTRTNRYLWHPWYAWHPVICNNASGGVAWASTIWRRHRRGEWEYQIEPGSEDDHRVGRLGRPLR